MDERREKLHSTAINKVSTFGIEDISNYLMDTYSIRLMGRQDTLLDQDWRLEQLMFLFNYGLCEVSNVGIELARKCIRYVYLFKLLR